MIRRDRNPDRRETDDGSEEVMSYSSYIVLYRSWHRSDCHFGAAAQHSPSRRIYAGDAQDGCVKKPSGKKLPLGMPWGAC
jgi:hypothetical protein